VAIDRAAGKIYWADGSGTTSSPIFVANLNGSGSPHVLFDEPGFKFGIAIDPAAGKILWTNGFMDSIRIGNLDGSGTASDLYSGERDVLGVAVDPVTGRVYWTDVGGVGHDFGSVRVGDISGSNPASDLFPSEDQPNGIAISQALGKVYWTDNGSGAIRVGNLDGSGYACSLYDDLDFLSYIAIDPSYGGNRPPECPPPNCPKVGLSALNIRPGPPFGDGPKVPGVRLQLRASPASNVDLGVGLRFRVRGHTRTHSFGRHPFTPDSSLDGKQTAIEARIPLPEKLRRRLAVNRRVTLMLDVRATPVHPGKCEMQSGQVRLKTRVKRVGLGNPVTSH